MRTYWGCKAVFNNGVCVGGDFANPECFYLYGEMSDGSKVYTDSNGAQYVRIKIGGKYVFVNI